MQNSIPYNTFAELLKNSGLLISSDFSDAVIKGISCNSAEVSDACLFFCKGSSFKEEYLHDAESKGACAYVSEKRFNSKLPCISVRDIRKSMALCADLFYGSAWKNFTLIGLTGTKGKSTTLYYLREIYNLYQKKQGREDNSFAYISTIDTFDGIKTEKSHLTTPESINLHRIFANAAAAGSQWLGMEVSSQALKYDRSYGLHFNIAAFLNFGPDHIDPSEHADEEDYLCSKLKIFDQSDIAIINTDCPHAERIYQRAASVCKKTIRCSVCGNPADYSLTDVHKEDGKTVFKINGILMQLSMPGIFNAENALFAYAIAKQSEIDDEICKEAFERVHVQGRMEVFEDKKRNIIMISDYAHNGLSFEKLLLSLKTEYPGRRIEMVFGCPGSKAISRRVELPQAAARYADYCYITEDDPGYEDAEKISSEVLANLVSFGGKGEIIIDRQSAIKSAYERALPNTVIVLAAKGREEYMKKNGGFVPVKSDAQTAAELTGNNI